MSHKCVKSGNAKVRAMLENLPKWAQAALIEEVKNTAGPGRLSGIPIENRRYIAAVVEEHEESIANYRTTVRTIVRLDIYEI